MIISEILKRQYPDKQWYQTLQKIGAQNPETSKK
jgi:hypothetical protein